MHVTNNFCPLLCSWIPLDFFFKRYLIHLFDRLLNSEMFLICFGFFLIFFLFYKRCVTHLFDFHFQFAVFTFRITWIARLVSQDLIMRFDCSVLIHPICIEWRIVLKPDCCFSYLIMSIVIVFFLNFEKTKPQECSVLFILP